MANRDVNLIIRAKDDSTRTVRSVADALAALDNAQENVTDSAAKTGGGLAALAGQLEHLESANAKVQGSADAASAAFDRQKATLSETKAAYAAVQGQIGAARAAIAALEAQERDAGGATAAHTAKVQAAKAEYRNLQGESKRLANSIDRQEVSLQRSNVSLQRIGSTANATAAALRKMQAANTGGGKGGGLLGKLKPYELQNLSYQVNDLITQIASGTSPMQAFVQQGGQIYQIIPGIGAAALRAAPYIGAFVVAFGLAAAAISRFKSNADTLKGFESELSSMGDGAAYSAERLRDAARDVDEFGASAEEAKKSVALFVRDGVAPDKIEAFGKAAIDMARVLGIDVTDAAKQVADAFTNTYDEIARLDDATGFLTAAEREHIAAMYDSGDAAGARNEALRLFSERMSQASSDMNGPWSAAIGGLESSWNAFLDALANSQMIQNAVNKLRYLALAATYVIGKLQGLDDKAIAARMNGFTAKVAVSKGDTVVPGVTRKRASDDARRDRIREENKKPRAPRKARKPGKSDAEKEAENAARIEARRVESLKAANAQREFELVLLAKTTKEAEILRALRAAENPDKADPTRPGATLAATEAKSIRDSVVALQARKAAIESTAAIAAASRELAEAQEQRITHEQYLQLESERESIDLLSAAGQEWANIKGQVFDIRRAQEDRDRALKAAGDGEQRVNDLLSYRQLLLDKVSDICDKGQGRAADALEGKLEGVNGEIQTAIAAATAMWEAIGGPESLNAIAALEAVSRALPIFTAMLSYHPKRSTTSWSMVAPARWNPLHRISLLGAMPLSHLARRSPMLLPSSWPTLPG